VDGIFESIAYMWNGGESQLTFQTDPDQIPDPGSENPEFLTADSSAPYSFASLHCVQHVRTSPTSNSTIMNVI